VGAGPSPAPTDPRVAALVDLDLSPDLAAGHTDVECAFTPRLRPSRDFQAFLERTTGLEPATLGLGSQAGPNGHWV
jgi:hypothetical protein